jgi:hypothetical protein
MFVGALNESQKKIHTRVSVQVDDIASESNVHLIHVVQQGKNVKLGGMSRPGRS